MEHSARIYGLNVRSAWPLPPTAEAARGRADVIVHRGSLPRLRAACLEAGKQPNSLDWFQHADLRDGSVYLRWPGLFEFLVSPDGADIAARPLARATQEAFRTYLLGHVLSHSLLKMGLEPLHATTVVIDGGAIALLGDCGYGKSTLGAAFVKAGYPLLTDDLLVLRDDRAAFRAFPGPPRLKLFPSVAARLLDGSVRGARMNHLTRKLVLPMTNGRWHHLEVPLRAVYVLSPPARRTARVTLRRFSRPQAALELLRNTFNDLVITPQRLKRQFALATRLAARVPMKRLAYPRKFSVLPEVCEAVLADLRS